MSQTGAAEAGEPQPSTEGLRGAGPPAEGTFTTESDGGTSSPPAAVRSCPDSRGAPLSVAEQQLAPAATPGAGAGASLERDGGGAGAPSRPPQDVDAADLTDSSTAQAEVEGPARAEAAIAAQAQPMRTVGGEVEPTGAAASPAVAVSPSAEPVEDWGSTRGHVHRFQSIVNSKGGKRYPRPSRLQPSRGSTPLLRTRHRCRTNPHRHPS